MQAKWQEYSEHGGGYFLRSKEEYILKWKLHRLFTDLLHNSTVMCTCTMWVHGYMLLQAPSRWLIHHIMSANGQPASLWFNAAHPLLQPTESTRLNERYRWHHLPWAPISESDMNIKQKDVRWKKKATHFSLAQPVTYWHLGRSWAGAVRMCFSHWEPSSVIFPIVRHWSTSVYC